jgi:thiol-disulfide isomerase/thioredoxin
MRSLWLSRRVAPAALVALVSVGNLQAQEKAPPAPTDQSPAAAPAATPAGDPFQIPQGNDPKVIQQFLAGLSKTQPENGGLPGRRAHLRKVEGILKQVQEKELDEQTAVMASDFRFQLLQVLERFGDETAAADRQKFVETLTKSKNPKIADRGTMYSIAGRISGIGEMKTDARKKLVDDVAAYIRAGDVSQERVEMAQATAELLSQLGETELASKALETFATALESKKDERLGDTVERMRGTGRRYGLVGKPMEVKGKTVDGKDFNLESLKGKVVLVDFWATWCGPCIEEMPHVDQLYRGYHSKGFEVVGISLDDKKEVLQEFLSANKVPWVQLFSDTDGTTGWSNPIAKHYGISGIPTAILIGKDGNVVSLDARAGELTKQLEKLLGPPDVKAEEPKEDAPKK